MKLVDSALGTPTFLTSKTFFLLYFFSGDGTVLGHRILGSTERDILEGILGGSS
jgi:hypothetical protein